MKSERVAIVGGGFSGTLAAAQLARRGVASVLIEAAGRLANGVAYSTREPAHLLNVPAAKMSAWPDAPDDFALAIEAEGGNADDFAERRRFARYLEDILADAKASGLVETVAEQAVRADRSGEGWKVSLAGGGAVEAEALVLAMGNQAPEPMRVAEGISAERFVNNPWRGEAKLAVERLAADGGDALILGTGLTMIDLVLSLDAAGHQGRITALSRRGQVPRAHAPFEPAPVELDEVPQGDVGALWRWVRKRGGEVGWRAAVDSLRPHSQALWQGLSEAEQRRFLRHARPYWDVHRHRIAPKVARRLRELVAEGRLEIVAGRVEAMREDGEDLEVSVRRRGGGNRTERYAVAFNCTGPLGTCRRTRDPMLRRMLEDGMVRMDHLDIALGVDAASRAGERIWALGPMTKGRFWEIIAVPDIRGQAAAVADDIATELAR